MSNHYHLCPDGADCQRYDQVPARTHNAIGAMGPRHERTVTHRGEMSPLETIGHAFLILCTCGLWVPVYLARKRKIHHTYVSERETF